MPTPKCKNCSKIIPDGFADCPWCGAKGQAKPATPSSFPAQIPGQVSSPSNADPLKWIAFLLSFAVFCCLQYLWMLRTEGELTFANSAKFLGHCAGSFVLAAILVFVFDKVRHRAPSTPSQLLGISSVACAMSILFLANPGNSRSSLTPAQMRHLGEVVKGSETHPDKWDPAIRPFFVDLISHNRQYIEDVSRLDNALQPLYSSPTFRDAASMQSILAALDQRLVIADRYADLQPLIAKVPTYLANVDASNKEKADFLAGFNESFQKSLGGKNSVSAQEHNWINSAIDLYRFALAHKNAYTYNSGNLLFQQGADSALFNTKLNHSRQLYVQFLRSYQASRRAQDVALTKIGLQPSDMGLDASK
jgi:hypothetical protein